MSSIGSVAFAPQIAAAAERYQLDPALLAAVAAQETGGPGTSSGANIVGDGGHGHGIFQIDDRYHPFAATPAAMDPGRNADYAAGMLAGLLQKYGGNVHAALSAYNSGSPTAAGTPTDWGGGVTLGYADSVMAHYAQLGGTARDAQIPDLAATSANVNQLQSLSSAAPAAAPAPALPTTQQQTQAQHAAAQQPLKQDFYADGDDAE
ncbi:MAG TPA: transglycosylase SLT domain-containing protein [Candidatus Aquilonibacter sp.]